MGDLEFGTCEICGNDAYLNRKYYYYDIKCECCNSKDDNHFEILRHCGKCVPKGNIYPHVLMRPIDIMIG